MVPTWAVPGLWTLLVTLCAEIQAGTAPSFHHAQVPQTCKGHYFKSFDFFLSVKNYPKKYA